MRVAVFFLCLCILLLRGYEIIHAGVHYSSTSAPVEKSHLSKFIGSGQDLTAFNNASSEGEEDSLINDDFEDDDTNSLSARKYKLLARTDSALSYLFILSYLHSCPKAPLNFCGSLSCKYITQNVLRI